MKYYRYSMKRILFIAPHSYPIKSSESICNSKVAYTLAKYGYKVDVFSCSNESTYPSDKRIDTILRDSSNISITSVCGKSMNRSMNKVQLFKLLIHHFVIFLKLGYYYNGIDYAYQIIKAIELKIKKEGKMPYDVMITRGFHTDCVGIYLYKKYKIRWIANWNDPFPILHFPKPYGEGFDAKLPYFEQKICNDIQKYVQLHTFPSERLRDYMLKCFPFVNKEETFVIHHMALSELSPKKNLSHLNKFTIVHTGSVNKPRDPKNFLEALSNVTKQIDIQIECIFIGGYDNNLQDLINKYDLSKIVSFRPAMTYSECVDFIASVDLSLIIEAICEEGIYLPTKFVDALQSKTPVFCVSPRVGTLHDLTIKYKVGYCADNTNICDIEEKLLLAINDYKDNSLPQVNPSDISPFFDDYILKQYNTII